MSPRSNDLLSSIFEASFRLLRRNPALWIACCLLGVLVALTLSTHAATWDMGDGIRGALAIAMAGIGLLGGWLALNFGRRAVTLRQRVRSETDNAGDDPR